MPKFVGSCFCSLYVDGQICAHCEMKKEEEDLRSLFAVSAQKKDQVPAIRSMDDEQ